MKHSKPLLSVVLSSLILLSSLSPTSAQAENSNNGPMALAILGAIGSLGLACYQNTAPCSLNPDIDTDKLTVSLDAGEDGTLKHTSMALGADWHNKVFEAKHWEVSGRLELSVHEWHSSRTNTLNDSGYMMGLAPVFHYQIKGMDYTPFVEMGGGPYLLSDVQLEDENKSTQFQFGSIFGLGIKRKAFEIGYRYLHISNADIEMPNPGTDIHNIHLGYHF